MRSLSARGILHGIAVIFCALALSLPATQTHAQDYGDGYNLNGPEELIFSVLSPPYMLSSGIIAYQSDERYYLPIVALANLFDFSVEPDLERGTVSGFALDEANTYSIDADRHEIVVAGKRETIDEISVLRGDAIDPSDLYVQIEVLNKLWPVVLGVNLSDLAVEVSSEQKLPFLERLERKDKREILLEMRKARQALRRTDLPFVPSPYRAFSLPVVDLDTEWRYDHHTDDKRGTLRMTGVNDLGYFQADYTTTLDYVDDKIERPDNIRLRLSRDAQGEDDIALGLRHVEFGDTRARHSQLIENGTSGRGAYVSTSDRTRDGEFDVTTVEGIATPGWEVELYRNNELLDFSIVDERGEYRFEDVPLYFGNNRIRLMFYGPQGQVRERVENYTFGSGMVEPGQVDYSLGVVDANEDLISLRDDTNIGQPEGVAAGGRVAYGLTKELTVFGTASRVPTRVGDVRNYATIGAAAALPFGVAQAEGYKESGGGHAVDMRFITELLGFNLSLRSALFSKFESPDNGFGLSAKRRNYEGDLSRNVKFSFGMLSLGLNAEHIEDVNKDTQTSYRTRQSLSFSGTRIGNTTTTNIRNSAHQTSAGQLSVNVRMREWLLRSQLDYDIFPERQGTNWQNELRYSEPDGFFVTLNLNHNLLDSTSSAGLQLGYDFEKFLGSVETMWDQDDGVSMMLRASTSFAPYGPDGDYLMRSERMGSAAPVTGRVYLDKNNDGAFNEGDEPLPEADIMIGTVPGENMTNENGTATNFGPAYRPVNITLRESSLEDPYYRAGGGGVSAFLRPGVVPSFDFPVVVTGALDGMVARKDGSPVQGMKLELVNEAGDVVMTSESAYDGYYTFEYVPPGTYVVRADPSYGVDVPPQTVTVGGDDLYQGGIDLELITPAAGGDDGAAAETESGTDATAETPMETPVETDGPPVADDGDGVSDSDPAAE